MDKTWIRTLTFALALAGCSSASESGSDSDEKDDDKEQTVDPSGATDAGSKRDAASTEKDSAIKAPEQTDSDASDGERTKDAGAVDAKVAERDANNVKPAADAGTNSNTSTPDPVCASMPGPGGFDPTMPPPGFIPDNIVSMADGVIFTTGGGVYKVPGKGLVFGRMENGACIVTVAETGVSTTVIGDGDVCINGHLVASGGKCLVDAEGDKITP